jgi:ComF family protein
MTSLLEKIIEKVAPHHCISCGIEDNIVCDACISSKLLPMPPVCCLCGQPCADWRLCNLCVNRSSIEHIWVGGTYEGLLERAIAMFKFERVRAASDPLSDVMLRVLPFNDWVVVPVPTAPPRVRQRGYDQAALLARAIAAKRGLVASPALTRLHNTRQVGANRVQREAQSTKMFFTNKTKYVDGANVLLVDDVCTTGATLRAAAQTLKAAGAAHIDAVVAAWQPPMK